MTRPQIFLIWILGSFLTTILAAIIAAQLMDMSLISPVTVAVIAIGFSVLHPGGWLSLGGLIWALNIKSLKPLLLAVLGAVLTGITVPLLEGIGAAAL